MKTFKLALLIAFCFALFNSVTIFKAEINWNGNDWALNCDFIDNDMSNEKTDAPSCGPKCVSTSGCTHFVWTDFNGGTCWLKQGAVSKSDAVESGTNGIVCGVVGNSGSETTVAPTL